MHIFSGFVINFKRYVGVVKIIQEAAMGKFVKRVLAFTITYVMLMAVMLGCSAKDAKEDKVEELEFTVVGEEQQPEALREIVAEKSAAAFQISYTLGEEMYIAVGYGEQPSGGYSISVNEFYETADSIVIDTTLIGPGKAENVTGTPTRPYIVVKTKNIEDKTIEFR